MKLYKPFVIAFILSVVALIVFMVVHFQTMFSFIKNAETMNPESPSEVFGMIFTPMWIASFILLILSSLTYQILGVIMIVKNPNINSTDRVLWILGFVMMAFITAIIFMALRKSKNLTNTEPVIPQNNWPPQNRTY